VVCSQEKKIGMEAFCHFKKVQDFCFLLLLNLETTLFINVTRKTKLR